MVGTKVGALVRKILLVNLTLIWFSGQEKYRRQLVPFSQAIGKVSSTFDIEDNWFHESTLEITGTNFTKI